MKCKWCSNTFEKKRKGHSFCNRECINANYTEILSIKAAKKHHRKEVKKQKLENERIKEQAMIFRFVITDLNSSPDAMRELAGLKPLQIKEAITYSELDGKDVSHIYENPELFNNA